MPQATTAPAHNPSSILPLPHEVAAQIKSSTAIVSLTGVVLELLKNALDARATRVTAIVDFARGACTVEDDGLGISPLEFREEGGLGKRHQAYLGCHGSFLASLAAVSLVSVTSRHHHHRSHNSVTFHHARAIERQLPAPAHDEIHGKHGTRVTVRNLFGNLPVRVKQRSKVVEQKAESDRLWAIAKARVVALLLSWSGPVSLKARDADNHVMFALNTTASSQTIREHGNYVSKPQSPHLISMLNILTQANYISVRQWSSWVPVSAATPTLSIKGAISLEPAPTKTIQFISLGNRPSVGDSEDSELHRHLNRLFRSSSFGVEEEHVQAEYTPSAEQLGKHSYVNGYTQPQSRPRKSVDRHPMFHLRIAPRDDIALKHMDEDIYHDEAGVQAIVEVLDAMVTQWLRTHHFRPLMSRRQRKTTSNPVDARIMSSENESTSTMTTMHTASSRHSIPRTQMKITRTGVGDGLVEKQIQCDLSTPNATKQHSRLFADWSRIKSGKAESFSGPLSLHKPQTLQVSANSHFQHAGKDHETTRRGIQSATSPTFIPPTLSQGSMTLSALSKEEYKEEYERVTAEIDELGDSSVWFDSVTKKTHLLNTRTGSVKLVTPLSFSAQNLLGSSLRLSWHTTNPGQTQWLKGLFQNWANPVFRTSEQQIKQIPPQDGQTQHLQQGCHSSHDKGNHNTFCTTQTRLSKLNLSRAKVLAQVDRKFILVRIAGCTENDSVQDASTPLLVLIDQHAADERIQVEALFQNLCSPVAASRSSYHSKLGHHALVASVMLEKPLKFVVSQSERLHFTTHASRFSSWGILYDFADLATDPRDMRASHQRLHLLCVTALPPTISERCRIDTRLLISFLRSTVWRYASDSSLPTQTSLDRREGSPNWVRRLGDCPEGLVDMVNSRACRSAIMFNDQLDMDQCSKLVKDLASCTFPFACAHGRPSMVPLGNMGDFENTRSALSSDVNMDMDRGNFVLAWKQWKQRTKAAMRAHV